MAAQAEPSLTPLTEIYTVQRMRVALHGCAALLVVAIGVLSLLDGSRLRQILESWINIHALFGVLLLGLVLAQAQWRNRHPPGMLPTDIREWSRRLSRMVFLLLYVVIGVRQAIGLINIVCQCGRVGLNAKDDFRMFLATGLLMVIGVRVLACGVWLRSVECAAARRNSNRS